ncbi:MAG: hypothetical protein IJN15_04780 [Clostridia bacterium]|nr:hypothetical protein [Clostridia bacterium]
MKKKDEFFQSSLRALLNEELSEAEKQSLKDEGYLLKKPKRKAAVMIALYKKASSGDLAAIKELRSIAGMGGEIPKETRAVTIIDDIAD